LIEKNSRLDGSGTCGILAYLGIRERWATRNTSAWESVDLGVSYNFINGLVRLGKTPAEDFF